MCNFLSVIVLRNGDVLHHPMLDSHSDLVQYFKLPDKQHARHFAKVEFTPKIDKDNVPQYADYKAYTLRVDEDTEPAWFDEVRDSVEKKLLSIVKAMIVDDDTMPLVLDGCRILVKGAKVQEMRGGRAMFCAGEIGVLSGGTVQSVESGGTVQSVESGGTVQRVLSGGTVQRVWSGGTVQSVESGGTVQRVLSGGTVQSVLSGGTVQRVWSGGTVQRVESGGTVQRVESGGTVQRVLSGAIVEGKVSP